MCIYVHSTVCRYSTVPYIPNIHNVFANIGHRFGQHSGLNENSGRNSTTLVCEFAFRVYLMFSKVGKNFNYQQILTKTVICGKKLGRPTKKKLAASLKRRKWGLGIPIHMRMIFVLNTMSYLWKNTN